MLPHLSKNLLKVENIEKYVLKVEQVADIDVLPASERMMSDRMRQGGRERLLWADDAMVAVRLPKVELTQYQTHQILHPDLQKQHPN